MFAFYREFPRDFLDRGTDDGVACNVCVAADVAVTLNFQVALRTARFFCATAQSEIVRKNSNL
jgi:hypothetical protein